ncbi:MAG: phage tail tape measure protein [Faecalibacillus intestinalis]|uniref:phage tail tape measure protein n=1 Tax=Faecalibacillus intestinalis TaxID=1982626 RepID=UPI0039964011
MADGKVVIDLEINDKSVDKKLNTADKKVDKFAKDVSQKEAKPNVDADTKKLEKKLDEASNEVESFSKEATDNAKVESSAKMDTSNFEKSAQTVKSEASAVEKAIDVDGKVDVEDKASSKLDNVKKKADDFSNENIKPPKIDPPDTDGFEEALQEMEDKVKSFGAKIAGYLAIGEAIKQGTEIGKEVYADFEDSVARVKGALGETDDQARQTAQVIKDVYEAGLGESMDRVAEAVVRIKRNLGEMDDGTLNSITQQAIILEDTFDVDMNETLRGVKGLMKNFGLTAQEAMDYIVAGTQEGLDWTDELGDNISEYSGKFSQAGYSASEYFQLLKNGSDSGAYNLDKVNDAINEVTTRLADGTIEGALGSFSSETQKTFKAWQDGKATQKDVIDSIVSDITKCDDQQKALTMSATAFGTMGEDANLTFAKALNSVGTTFDDVKGKGEAFSDETTTPMQELESKVRKVKDQLQPLGDLFYDIAGVVLDNFAPLSGIIVTVATAIATYKAITSAADVATKGLAAAQKLLSIAMNGGGFGLVLAGITALVAGFLYLWNTSDGFRKFWSKQWENIKASFQSVADILVPFFTKTLPEAFNGLVETFQGVGDSIVEFFVGIGETIASFFTETIPEAFNSFIETVSGFVDSVVSFFSELPYNIGYAIGYIIALIVDLGMKFVEFVTVDVPNFVTGFISWISQLPGQFWTYITDIIGKVAEFALNLISKGYEAGSNFVSSVISFVTGLPGQIWSVLSNAIGKVAEFVVKMGSKGIEAAKSLWDGIVNTLSGLPGKMADVGKNIVEGIWNGIKNAKDWLLSKIGDFANGVVDGIKGFFGIHSPSKVMRDAIGKFLPPGIAVGFEVAMPKAQKSMNKELEKMTSDLNGIINFNLDDIELKTNLDIARQTAFESNVTNELKIDYDKMGNSTAKAIKNSGMSFKVDKREFARII